MVSLVHKIRDQLPLAYLLGCVYKVRKKIIGVMVTKIGANYELRMQFREGFGA